MKLPSSIDSAPRDGTVILTNEGFALFLDQKNWGSPVAHGRWASCDPSGFIFDCVDEGPYYCNPTIWMDVPEWIK